jgi:two-component system response regulator AtoC
VTGSILLVDDDPGVLSTLSHYFQLHDLEVLRAMTGREAAELYESERPDVALVDLRLPDLSGLDLLQLLHRSGATVIILTGHGDIPTAVQAVKSGAENFLTKPVDLGHLDAVVERALEKARLKRVQSHLRESPNGSTLEALGSSPQMREVAAQIERAAQSERTTVLLLGESGTGKGWVAERIHHISPRRQAAFVEVNCSTLTGTFLESELFGHEKGAFTDAKTLKRGLFEVADRGTIFLDEITDMEPGLQPKLLNVLESRAFRRIGGTREIAVDVRVIAASNTDIQRAVAEQVFREDLFYRLNVMPIELPPLRKRSQEDVAELALRILSGLSREFPRGPQRLSESALELLVRYSWPGNVRELRNVLERGRILAGDAETLEPAHLPAELRGGTLSSQLRNDDLPSLEELERRHISRVLSYFHGNRTRAAQRLGISRATLHNKINRYGLKTVGLEAG